jgi:orotidine-5'-phosphate decarboxylase
MTELIVALDDTERMVDHCIRLHGEAGVQWFKLNARSMMHAEHFHHVIRAINARGLGLFLDLKLYDTKDTVRLTMFEAIALGAKMLTVHADCVIHTVDERRLKILAVRGLTDGTNDHDSIAPIELVDGIICSVRAASLRRQFYPAGKLLVCPGIRPADWPAHNHLNAATPQQAAEAGADYIVVGRPIICAPDPVEAAKHIQRNLHAIPPDPS